MDVDIEDIEIDLLEGSDVVTVIVSKRLDLASDRIVIVKSI